MAKFKKKIIILNIRVKSLRKLYFRNKLIKLFKLKLTLIEKNTQI